MAAGAHKITVKAFDDQKIFTDCVNIDSAKTYQIDYSPWAEENNSVTTMTWTTKTGQATIASKALASNVASALITFGTSGKQLIQVKADSGTEIKVIYLDISVKDPDSIDILPDYNY